MVVPKVNRKTLAEQIGDAIMDAIMNGSISMGDKLVTQDLADQFGVSRMPVREALISLQANGLVESTAYAGFHVAALDSQRISEIYLIRRALEPIAAREAVNRLTEEQIENLEDLIRQLSEAALSDSPSAKRIYIQNRRFHFALYEAADMPEVTEMIRMAWDRIAIYKLIYSRKYVDDRQAAENMVEEHQRFVDAIRERDSEKLVRLLEESIAWHEMDVPVEFLSAAEL